MSHPSIPSITKEGVNPPQMVDVIALPRKDVERIEQRLRTAVWLLTAIALFIAALVTVTIFYPPQITIIR